MKGSCLGVIPARGGSKGIPRKNIRLLAGRPLIFYTIAAAKGSRCLTRWIVSTDDREIAEVARSFGAEVPFQRPEALARDEATAVEVAAHALAFVEAEEKRQYDFLALLEPTSPLRRAEDVDAALTMLDDSGADSVVGLCRLEAPHPAKLKVVEEGIVRPYLPHLWREGLLRQQLPPVYYLNGAVYGVRRKVLLEEKTFWGKNTLPYVMPAERSVNIDTWIDFKLAECFINEREER